MAKVALMVSTKIELAAIRWRRSTIRGIDVSSAGAKIAVAVATPKLMRYTSGTLALAVVGATKMNATMPTARTTLVASMISFALLRSTSTPPSVLNSTAGTRKVRISSATAVSEPVVRRTVAMSAARTMLLASWLSVWADHR